MEKVIEYLMNMIVMKKVMNIKENIYMEKKMEKVKNIMLNIK